MSGKEKLLITGGLGNLGSWLSEYLSPKYDLYILSKNVTNELSCQYILIQADITDINDLKIKLNMQFDYCIHSASYNEFFHENYPSKALEINALGTRNLVEILKDTKIKVISSHSRWVKTELGGPNAPVEVKDSFKTSLYLATLKDDGPTGGLFHGEDVLPW